MYIYIYIKVHILSLCKENIYFIFFKELIFSAKDCKQVDISHRIQKKSDEVGFSMIRLVKLVRNVNDASMQC